MVFTRLAAVIIILCFQGTLSQLVCRDGQLRLGDDFRLWACTAGQWGTVCFDDYFNEQAAYVACKNLGYVDVVDVTFDILYGSPGFVALGSLQCDGTETYLQECVKNFDYLNNCDQNDHLVDVFLQCTGTPCTNGDVRLVNGFNEYEGTVEICIAGVWNTICQDGFGGQEAYVTCRQLGLNASTAQIPDTSFSTGHGWSPQTKYNCTGTESALSECGSTSSDQCLSYDPYTGNVRVAQLRCSGDPAPDICSGTGARLNDNGVFSNIGTGRLELCQSRAWGTVNNNMFSVKDSLVACRHMAVPNPSTQVYPQGYFENNVAGPIILRDLVCLGSENSLYTVPPLGCNPGTPTIDLDHTTDVFISCWSKVGATCNDGDVRLVDGYTLDEGRVEVCKGKEWGTFCDTFWDRREAQVICKQLGYPNSYGAFYRWSKYGTGVQIPYFYTDLNCTGSENGIVSCPFDDQIEGEKCLFGRAVGVKCYNNTGCTNNDIRLVGGNDFEGDVQICRNGVWGYICDTDWTDVEAKVTCRGLEYSEQLYARSTSSLFGGTQDTAPIVYDSMDCSGGEPRLSSCSKGEYGSLYPTCLTVAGVTCLVPDEGCTNGDVRLMDGVVSSEGRVEVCARGSWTTLKASEIMTEDAKVICTELGYNPEWAVATEGNTWGTGDRMIFYDQVSCTGTEKRLIDCSTTTLNIDTDAFYWYNEGRAGVSCERTNLAESCNDEGAVRLKDGATAREGRLEICVNGYWGSVCNRGWTQDNGLVACRQAGYETLRPLLSSDSFNTRMNGPISVYDVQCSGYESQLSSCDWSNAIANSSCSHEDDVGLICSALPDMYSVITIGGDVSEPIPLGTEVTLSCDGAPDTDDLYYSWSRDGVELEWKTSTITFTVGVQFPKYFNIYCRVYRWNEHVGVGMRKFRVQDLLVSSDRIITGTLGSDITLTFTRTWTHINQYLRDPVWTRGNTIINPSTWSRYSVSNDGLSLTIKDLQIEDLDIYSLYYNGLDIQMQNEFCEQTVLSYMREYPVFSTGYIILNVQGFPVDLDEGMYNNLLIQENDLLNYTLGSLYQILEAHRFSSIPSDAALVAEWYFNGAQYLQESILTLRDNYPLYQLIVGFPTLFDSGYYQLVLKFPFDDILLYSGCSKLDGSKYLEFLQSTDYLGLTDNYFILDTTVVEMRYNEKPTAQLTTNKSNFMATEDATITCEGSGGYPRYYEISLWKDDTQVMSVTSSMLIFNTADIAEGLSRYGEYSCQVNNMLLQDTTSITVYNAASISIPFNSGNCIDWDDSDIPDIEAAMLERFDDTCNCTLGDEAKLKDSILSCPEGRDKATFNTTLVYSNADGTLLAWDIVNSTLEEFNNRTNRTLPINGIDYRIDIGPADPSKPIEISDGALIGIIFVAGFLSGVIILVVAGVIVYLKFIRKPRKNSSDPVHFHNQGENVKVGNKGDNFDGDFEPPPPEDDD